MDARHHSYYLASESQIGKLSWPLKEVMIQTSFPRGLSRKL